MRIAPVIVLLVGALACRDATAPVETQVPVSLDAALLTDPTFLADLRFSNPFPR